MLGNVSRKRTLEVESRKDLKVGGNKEDYLHLVILRHAWLGLTEITANCTCQINWLDMIFEI